MLFNSMVFYMEGEKHTHKIVIISLRITNISHEPAFLEKGSDITKISNPVSSVSDTASASDFRKASDSHFIDLNYFRTKIQKFLFQSLQRPFCVRLPVTFLNPSHKFQVIHQTMPVTLAAKSKAWVGCHSCAEILISKPIGGMDVYLL
jgi:hypothetical protein